ncbi:MAG TPA: hypothetical protein VJV78_20070, partial [Polyangiales bacterium]|nr:hypothetical protein [Polyangiales bacterium]
TRLVHSVVAVAASTYDHGLLDALPVLDPLLPLSAALAIAAQNVGAARAMISGRHLASIAIYRRMLARLDEPDLAGHEPTLHRYVRLAFVYACAHNEAGLGFATALRRAEELSGDPLHKLNALRVQVSYYLSQGDALRAESCRQQVELLEIQNAPVQFFEGHDAFRYLPAYAALDDLPNVKRMCDIIEGLAKRHPGWVAVRHYAAGEYARIRGDHGAALWCFGEALQHSEAGRDQVWPRAAEQYLYTLVVLGRAADAEAQGRAWCEAWEQHELVGALGVAQAFCEAATGAHAAALSRLDAILERWTAAGMQGVQVGRAWEIAARIAREAGDIDRFEIYAARCHEAYTPGDTPVLLARYRRLQEDPQPLAPADSTASPQLSAALRRVTTDLARHEGTLAIARRSLELLLESSAAPRGFLFGIQAGQPALIAADDLLPAGMQSYVQAHYRESLKEIRTRAQTRPDVTQTQSIEPPDAGFGSQADTYRPLVLYHRVADTQYIIALAMLAEPPEGLRFPSPWYLSAIGEALFGCEDLERVGVRA